MMKSLVINNQFVKTKRKLTTMIKSGETLNVNNMTLLKEFVGATCDGEALLFGFKMYDKYDKIFKTVINDLNDIGDLFDFERYDEYCKYRQINKNSNGVDAYILKYGEKDYKHFYNKNFNNKESRWDISYHTNRGSTEEEAIEIIKNAKENIAGSSSFFINKYGEIDGVKKYIEFGEKSKHTKENYIEKYGYETGNIKWEEYVDKKRETSIFNKEVWMKKHGEKGKELFHNFIKENCSTGTLDFWIKNGFSKDEAITKIQLINDKKGVKFRTASKQSIKKLSTITELCDKLNIDYLMGVDGNSEKMLISECNKYKFYDFCIEEFKLIIEYNHEKYHPRHINNDYKNNWLKSNSAYFNEEDFYKFIENDKFKYKLVLENGYHIHYIWEDSTTEEVNKIKDLIYENFKNRKE